MTSNPRDLLAFDGPGCLRSCVRHALAPRADSWRAWRLPGDAPKPYAVYVDDQDIVWLSDFGANAMVRFDPGTESFESFPSPRPGANVRQILGRPGEVWAPESGTDRLVVLRTG